MAFVRTSFRFAVACVLLATGLGLAESPHPRQDNACGIVVCGAAATSIGVGCGRGVDGSGNVFAWCTVTLNGTLAGSSPAYLPGRADGEAIAHATFTCLNACAGRDRDVKMPLATWWKGGPGFEPLGLGPGAVAGGRVLRDTQVVFAPIDGSRACVHVTSSVSVRGDATVVSANSATVPVETVHVEDARNGFGMQCI